MKLHTLSFTLFITLLVPITVPAQTPLPFVSGTMAKIKTAHAKHPFVMSFWSIDCSACFQELVMWQQLTIRYPNLKIILVNTDTSDVTGKVEHLTHELGVDHLESWQFADPYVERIRFEIDKKWYGELPRTYFFIPGKETWAISGAPERARVEEWINQYSPAQTSGASPSTHHADKAS